MRRFIFCFLPFLFFFTAIAFVSCERDDDDSPPGPSGNSSTIKTQVLIHASDQNGDILPGVTIRIGNSTVLTDNFGNALFRDISVDKTRFIVKATKIGMFDAIKGVSIQQGNTSYHVRFAMKPLPTPAIFNSSSGGSINLNNGGSINFSPGSIATSNGTAYIGVVKVYAHHFSPDDVDFEKVAPGGDFLGIDDDGKNVALTSFGMMNVLLQDPFGNPLNLLPGTTAQLSFPIAASQSATAPSTIPMWYLDETTSLWMEEGVAVKQGNIYMGTVSHFSTWNCDYPGERANIMGTVVDCNGNPVSGIIVTINGFMDLTTNSAGVYSTWVPAGWSISYEVIAGNNLGLTNNSPSINFSAIANQNNTVPPLILQCLPFITGITKDCDANPVNALITFQQGAATFQSYQSSSQFNLMVPFTGTSKVVFQTTFGSFDTTINIPSGTAGTVSLGTLMLCDTNALDSTDHIIIHGGPYQYQYYVLANAFGDATIDSSGNYTNLFHSGVFSTVPNSWYNLYSDIMMTGTGSLTQYAPSNFSLEIHDNGFDFELILGSQTDYVTYSITNWNSVSGIVEVEIVGTVSLYDWGSNTTIPAWIVGSHFTFNLL